MEKIIDCSMLPDDKFQALKRAMDMANDPNRDYKMYIGAVVESDMERLNRFFGYEDTPSRLIGFGCGVVAVCGLELMFFTFKSLKRKGLI